MRIFLSIINASNENIFVNSLQSNVKNIKSNNAKALINFSQQTLMNF